MTQLLRNARLPLLSLVLVVGCGPAASNASGPGPACPRAEPCPTPVKAECPRERERERARAAVVALAWPSEGRLVARLGPYLYASLMPPERGAQAPAKPRGTVTYDFEDEVVKGEAPSLSVPAAASGAPADLPALAKGWSQAAEEMKAGRFGRAANLLEALYRQAVAGQNAKLARQILDDLVTALGWDGASLIRANQLFPGLVSPADKPHLPALYIALAARRAEQGDQAEALRLLEHVVDSAPTPPEPAYQASLARARIHVLLQRYDLALQELSRLLGMAAKGAVKPSAEFTQAMGEEVTRMANVLHDQANHTRHKRHMLAALGLYEVAKAVPARRSAAERRRTREREFDALSSLVRSVSWTEPKPPKPRPCKAGVYCHRVIRMGRAVLIGRLGAKDIRRIIRAHLPEVRSCYGRELLADPALEGKVRLKLELDPFGWVDKAQVTVASGSLAKRAASLVKCLSDRAREWRFPEVNAFYSTKVTLFYPFKLSPTR